MKTVLKIILIFIFSNCIAEEADFTLSAGPKYSSGIEYLYLLDRIDLFIEEKKAEEKKSAFITTDIAAAVRFNSFSAEYSLASDAAFPERELSRMNQFAEITGIKDINDFLSFDLTLQIHHAAENYEKFTNLYTDTHLFFNLFYDVSEKFSLSLGLKTGYYRPLNERLNYLNGYVSGVEGSVYIYPEEDMNFIRILAGLDYFSFRDETVRYDFNEESVQRLVNRFTLRTQNKYLKFYSAAELSWKKGALTVVSRAGYGLAYWPKADSYTFSIKHNSRPEKWSEKRIEHIPEISGSLLFDVTEYLGLKIYGDLRHNFSTLGDSSDDYTNYSSTSYSVGFSTILKI